MTVATEPDGARLDLLRKTELRVVGIDLVGSDLNAIAAAAADVLGFASHEVLVTDVLEGVVTFDVLRSTVYSHQLLARERALLERLATVDGVRLHAGAAVEADGVLGWIAADAAEVAPAIAAARTAAEALLARVAKRVQVFSTGDEVVAGAIHDTNRPLIEATFRDAGYACDFGGRLRDDLDLIAGAIRRAVHDGYGVVVTTGGVGAETKDQTVEALLRLDRSASTPYIATFEVGHGRHAKPGVRIAVGRHEQALLVALPGPNDEVALALPVLLRCLERGDAPETIAAALAESLRRKLRDRMQHRSEA